MVILPCQNESFCIFLEKPIEENRRSQWSWIFFEKNVPLSQDLQDRLQKGEKIDLVLTSKAFNASWNVQPDEINYNAHGCCVNHCYKVPVTLCPKAKENIVKNDEFVNKPSGGEFKKPFRNFDKS